MIQVASLFMVGAGAVCLGGAVLSRKGIAIASASIMFAAMLDLAFIGVVPALIWAAALVLAGMLLGLELRMGVRVTAKAAVEVHIRGLRQTVMVASALAYPVTAWLVLSHGTMVGSTATRTAGAHAGHSAGAPFLSVPLLLAYALTALLLVMCAWSTRRKQVHLAVETGAMAVMILAMLMMPH